MCLYFHCFHSTGKVPQVEVDMSRIPNFQDSEPAASIELQLPRPPVPPKKAKNMHSSQVEPEEISVPVLPPKPKTTFIPTNRYS